jgi:hypothetical protein
MVEIKEIGLIAGIFKYHLKYSPRLSSGDIL